VYYISAHNTHHRTMARWMMVAKQTRGVRKQARGVRQMKVIRKTMVQ
jgi:hypothetical protein